jgi:hypothetical protein
LRNLGSSDCQVFEKCAVKLRAFIQIDIGDFAANIGSRNCTRNKVGHIHVCDFGTINGIENNIRKGDAKQSELAIRNRVVRYFVGGDSIARNFGGDYCVFGKIICGNGIDRILGSKSRPFDMVIQIARYVIVHCEQEHISVFHIHGIPADIQNCLFKIVIQSVGVSHNEVVGGGVDDPI